MKVLKIISIAVNIIIINNNIIYPQVIEEWIARYNGIGNGSDVGSAISFDNQGNVYVTGHSSRTNQTSGFDYATIKYNSSGAQQWVAIYNGPANNTDYATSIAVDNFGNVYVTGWSEGIGTNDDYATIKYDSSGYEQWVERFNGTANMRDEARSIALDTDGDIYVTGYAHNNVTSRDYTTIKYNSLGVQQWVASYDGSLFNDEAFVVKVDKYKNVHVTGRSNNPGTSGDYATVKYNSLGVQQWTARYSGTSSTNVDEARALVIDSSGNVYVSGKSSGAMNYFDYLTVKYDSSGVLKWIRRYEGSAHFLDQAYEMVSDESGNIYVTGFSTESGGRGYDYTTIKYNTNGDQVWLVKYTNGTNDLAYSIAIDKLANIYVTGQSDGSGTGFDYATVKYDSSGIQKWVKRYSSLGDTTDYAMDIAVDNSSNVYVTGYTSRFDYLTIKYSQPTEINQLSSDISAEFKLYQNYPNPFNPKTIINCQLSLPDGKAGMFNDVQLKVYGILGNEIITLVNEKQNAGSHQVEFDGINYPSGIYFYRLEVNGNIIDTKRMILLK